MRRRLHWKLPHVDLLPQVKILSREVVGISTTHPPDPPPHLCDRLTEEILCSVCPFSLHRDVTPSSSSSIGFHSGAIVVAGQMVDGRRRRVLSREEKVRCRMDFDSTTLKCDDSPRTFLEWLSKLRLCMRRNFDLFDASREMIPNHLWHKSREKE